MTRIRADAFGLVPSLYALAAGDSAVSAEAEALRSAAAAIMESAERSEALFGQRTAAISRLVALAIECADEDWDGNGAAAIDPVAVVNTKRFLRALPGRVPLPELAPEPDGSISLDWIWSPDRLFSLSIGRGNRLAFAWMEGTDSGHAVARFDGHTVPQLIVSHLERLRR